MPLKGSDKKHLRKLAHGLDPVARVGGNGLTPALVKAVDGALADHELIKLKIPAGREERKRLADEIAAETGSELAGMVGQGAILYRPAADEDEREIVLPSAG